MATVSTGYTWVNSEVITAAKLNNTAGAATVSEIVNADVNASAGIVASKLNLASIAQVMAMTSMIFKSAKGADVASAAGNIALGEDGNYFDITGTAAITSITAKQAGTIVVLQFDSTASLVNGSNLKLSANFQGAALSQIILVSDGTNWIEVSRNFNISGATFTGLANIPAGAGVIPTANFITGITGTITVIIDGGGSAITTGIKADLEIPFACTLNQYTLLADQSGAIKIDIWKDTYANYPPTNDDSICSGKEPEIAASGTKAQDTDISDWTTVSIAAGNILRFNVDSVATITRAVLSLKYTRS